MPSPPSTLNFPQSHCFCVFISKVVVVGRCYCFPNFFLCRWNRSFISKSECVRWYIDNWDWDNKTVNVLDFVRSSPYLSRSNLILCIMQIIKPTFFPRCMIQIMRKCKDSDSLSQKPGVKTEMILCFWFFFFSKRTAVFRCVLASL